MNNMDLYRVVDSFVVTIPKSDGLNHRPQKDLTLTYVDLCRVMEQPLSEEVKSECRSLLDSIVVTVPKSGSLNQRPQKSVIEEQLPQR